METEGSCGGQPQKNTARTTFFEVRKQARKKSRALKKFRWHDGEGRELTAGGILPYDNEGIWVIGEKKKNGDLEWTDAGGKYKFEDCNIYTTCAREFGEELYYSTSIPIELMSDIVSTHKPVYVNGHNNKPVYICYVVHVDVLSSFGITLDPVKFLECRERAVSDNPHVPEDYYNSVCLQNMSFLDIAEKIYNSPRQNIDSVSDLSYRLKKILKHGPLATKIFERQSESVLFPMSRYENYLDVSPIFVYGLQNLLIE